MLENFCPTLCLHNTILSLQHVVQIQCDLIFCNLLGRQNSFVETKLSKKFFSTHKVICSSYLSLQHVPTTWYVAWCVLTFCEGKFTVWNNYRHNEGKYCRAKCLALWLILQRHHKILLFHKLTLNIMLTWEINKSYCIQYSAKKKTRKYHINKTALKLLFYKYYLLPMFVEFDVRL